MIYAVAFGKAEWQSFLLNASIKKKITRIPLQKCEKNVRFFYRFLEVVIKNCNWVL